MFSPLLLGVTCYMFGCILVVFGLFWQSTYTYLAAYGGKSDLYNSNSPKELTFMTVRHGVSLYSSTYKYANI